MSHVVKEIEAKVEMVSCVGIHGKPPHKFGNYFGFREGYCVNMWAENLRAAVGLFLPQGTIEVALFAEPPNRKWVVVTDPRIPKDWFISEKGYQTRFCFTGMYKPSLETVREMFDVAGGVAGDELEQWTNPVEFWARRGCKYNPETGLISFTIGGKK